MKADPLAAPPTAAEAARAIARGRLSSLALTQYCLDRIKAVDGKLHSFVLVTQEHALRAARAADRAQKAGKRRGPLHGVPYALKDIYETAGIRTTAQSHLLMGHVPKQDCTVARKLHEAGAVLLGKLATHEFATGGPAFDLPFPPVRNPWNTDHFTGGSSSGSGAAIAAGLAPLTMGSDTSGSIRGPAGFCGIAGHKPTYGLVSRAGVIPLSQSLDHCGPMCWTAEDCALMLEAIAGPDAADPANAGRSLRGMARAIQGGVKGMRIGVVRHFFERDIEGADPQSVQAIEDALKVLSRLGAKLVNVTLAPHADWDACARILLYAEAYAIHARDLQERPDKYAAITRGRIIAGEAVTAAQYINGQRWRRQLCRTYAQAMEGLDALVTGGTMTPAPRIDALIDPPYFAMRGKLIMAPFNVTGAPALSVCAGFSRDGLPLSLQIAGKPFDDAKVLRIGHSYEQATEWRKRRPAV
jgi:aspartyl-tRNA(Asn)/glutamyl-tRNA(Gln) amidotransferase subunit A